MEGLRETLAPLGIKVSMGQVVKPHLFQRIVSQASGKPDMAVVSMAVLRSQAQAEYNPYNIGHFGLRSGAMPILPLPSAGIPTC